MLCKDKFRPLIAASRRQETKRRFAVMCSSHSLTLIHTHIPARLHNMATNYIKQCLCLLFLSHGKFVRRLAFCCRISEAEPQNCHVNCKKKWKLHKFTPQTFYIFAYYEQHKIWLYSVHPDRAVSKCLSVRVHHLLALQRVDTVDTANCLLVTAQPKVLHSNEDNIKLRHVINFKNGGESIQIPSNINSL